VQQKSIPWRKVKAVIFDVDGTLYSQEKLRPKMLVALLTYYALRPWRFRELLLLQRFRTEREKRPGAAGPDLENAQYDWCVPNGHLPTSTIRKVVDQWIFRYPLRYLPTCTYPGTQSFFKALQRQNIKIAIYSDYQAHAKLAAMGLPADLIVSSLDPEVDHLKPAPHGLLYVARKLGLPVSDCLFIGDRPELDGLCAEQAGMPFLLVEKLPVGQFNFYQQLEASLAQIKVS